MPDQQSLGPQLATLGERMQHLDKAVNRLTDTIEALDKRFVTIPQHEISLERMGGRLSVLEEAHKERKADGGFFGALRKGRDIALTVTIVLAAIAALATIARSWPVH